MGYKMGSSCQPGFQKCFLGPSTVGKSAVFTKAILSWFVHPKYPLCFWFGTFRGILQKTFWIRQWHLGYDSSHLTLAAHEMQSLDKICHLATRHPVPHGLLFVTSDFHAGLAGVILNTEHRHILQWQPAELLSLLLRHLMSFKTSTSKLSWWSGCSSKIELVQSLALSIGCCSLKSCRCLLQDTNYTLCSTGRCLSPYWLQKWPGCGISGSTL